jgi:hypothetical protein
MHTHVQHEAADKLLYPLLCTEKMYTLHKQYVALWGKLVKTHDEYM